jgi:hypothetical protein
MSGDVSDGLDLVVGPVLPAAEGLVGVDRAAQDDHEIGGVPVCDPGIESGADLARPIRRVPVVIDDRSLGQV